MTTVTPQRQVANTLVKLRLQVEDLDPSKAEGGIGHALLNLLPFRNQIRELLREVPVLADAAQQNHHGHCRTARTP